ncbi:ornithine carbamoyltransferase [Paenibacillus ihuae]|uniref:ornithine carbamoyltransferase n=1 Tax=Paenibacillus ihuae TaxID=1232431 RepID=UPI0006D5731F|nr:ornithine carbamoyltransferase [Paenibacillus ihuae]
MHLLDLESLSSQQIIELFQLARHLSSQKPAQLLKDKTFIRFFPESSLRTRITFEKGIQDFGGKYMLFPPETLDKREQSSDVIHYLENWADGVVARHSSFTKLVELSAQSSIPIINAMTARNHPCEILSDLYSISQIRENYRELTYTFVGPASNISRTWHEMAKVMNLSFNHVCSAGNELGPDTNNYTYLTNLEDVLPESDIILTDSLPGEFNNDEYLNLYQITLDRMKRIRPGALLNPCPPFYRNEEVSSEVIDSPYFAGFQFKKNLLYMHQAVILYCLSN